MPFLRTEIKIQARSAAVWVALADFTRYGEWNPMLRRVEGELRPGAKIRFALKLPGMPMVSLPATVQGVEFGVCFKWASSLLSPRVLQGNHQFRLISEGNGATRFEQVEHYSGYFAFLATLAIPLIRRGFQQMNKSLKAYAEQGTTFCI